MTCSVPDCSALPVAKGLCARHYRAHKRDPGRELIAAFRRSESGTRPKVLVALTSETLERVTRLAAAEGQSVQDWVREAVERRLRQ